MNESSGGLTITVTRTGATSGTSSVQYSTADATALSPSDYTAATGILTFAPGESSKSFTIFVNDDLIRESTESFNIRLSSPSNATLGSTALATVNIVDNDKRKGAPPRGSTTLQNKAPLMDQ